MGEGSHAGSEDLGDWLRDGYGTAYRTACLILHSPADAEEAVQEAFLRAWRFRATIAEGADVRPWLYRVLVNTCCSRLRTETARRARTADAGALDDLPATDTTPEAALAAADTATAVRQALAALPSRLRIPVVLRYYAGLSEREIASAIRRRPGTVKSRLHEARRLLAADPSLGALTSAEEVEL